MGEAGGGEGRGGRGEEPAGDAGGGGAGAPLLLHIPATQPNQNRVCCIEESCHRNPHDRQSLFYRRKMSQKPKSSNKVCSIEETCQHDYPIESVP